MSRFRVSLLLVFSLFLLTSFSVISLCHSSPSTKPITTPPPIDPDVVAPAEKLSKAFEAVAAYVKPAVVSVFSEKIVKFRSSEALPLPFNDDLFRHFFGGDFGDLEGPPLPEGTRQFNMPIRGVGSGMLLDHKGHVLTNYHVVKGFDEIKVELPDHSEHPAKVTGFDPRSDVAVIEIKGSFREDLPIVSLGDSDQLKVGDFVLAIGAPFGLPQTVTQGIISGTGRANVGILDYENFLQTDAAINPGNSGGPLVNMRGEVVGINSAIATSVGQFSGVGFSIPINMVKESLPKLLKGEKIVHGELGIVIQDLNDELARQFGLKQTSGVLVSDVHPGSSAEKAGLQVGDVILKYDNKPVVESSQLRNLVAATAPGTKVKIQILRKGAQKDLEVVIGKFETEERKSINGVLQENRLGLAVKDLPGDMKSRLHVKQGVLIIDVAEGSPASFAGIEPRDVIVEAEHQPVTNVKDLRKILEKAKDKDTILLLLKRQGTNIFVVIHLG